MQPRSAAADSRVVIRLPVVVVAAAFLPFGCSTEEGSRARELLQQAEVAQAKLHSATFEADRRSTWTCEARVSRSSCATA